MATSCGLESRRPYQWLGPLRARISNHLQAELGHHN